MRLDKFLKISRIIKRRQLASDAAKDEHVYVNSRVAKPSKEINVGDIIMIDYYKKQVSFKVKSVDLKYQNKPEELIEIIKIEEKEREQKNG